MPHAYGDQIAVFGTVEGCYHTTLEYIDNLSTCFLSNRSKCTASSIPPPSPAPAPSRPVLSRSKPVSTSPRPVSTSPRPVLPSSRSVCPPAYATAVQCKLHVDALTQLCRHFPGWTHTVKVSSWKNHCYTARVSTHQPHTLPASIKV